MVGLMVVSTYDCVPKIQVDVLSFEFRYRSEWCSENDVPTYRMLPITLAFKSKQMKENQRMKTCFK